MAENDLSIIVKTQVEVDESQAQKELKGFSDRISNDAKSKLKIPIDIDRAATMKNVDAVISDIQGKLKKAKFKVEIEVPKAKQVQTAMQKASASLFNEKAASQYWGGRFQESIKGLTAQNNQIKQMSKYYAQAEKEANKAAVAANKFKQTANTKASEIDSKQITKIAQLRKTLNAGGYEKSTTSGFQSLYSQLNTLENRFKEVQKLLQSDTLTESQFAEYTAELKSLEAQLTSTGNMVKNFNGSLASQNYVAKMQSNIGKLKSDFAELEVNWTKAFEIPELRTQIEEFRAKLADVDAVNFNQIKSEFIGLKSNIRAAGADCQSFGQQVKGIVSKMVGLVSVADVFMAIKRGATTAIENVKALDSAMVELKKVTDLTDRTYDKFLDNAGSRAKDIGTTFVDYVSGVADFSRLGYGLQDATQLSEASNILFRVGDDIESIGDSTDAVIASMKAYGIEVSGVSSIIDKLNEVSNKTSISTGGLVDAITRSASALSLSGLSLEKSLALIVAGNEATRNSSMTGNALKTLSMRIRGKVCASYCSNTMAAA